MTRRLGPYAPLSATYATDDAVIEAGEGAELLYVRGLAFCAASESDGFITRAQLGRFVGAGMLDVMDRAARLVEVGLWEEEHGGYFVRAWLKWNRSAEEIGRAKRKDRERKAARRDYPFEDDEDGAPESVDESDGIPDGIHTDTSTDSERNPGGIHQEEVPDSDNESARTPDGFQPRAGAREAGAGAGVSGAGAPNSIHSTPHQDTPPTPPRGKPGSRRAAYDYESEPGFVEFWKAFPEKEGKPSALKAYKDAVARGVAPEALTAAARAYAADLRRNPRKPKYPQGWLNDERYRKFLPSEDDQPTEAAHDTDGFLVPPWEA